jgi:hypothetical protein
MVDHSNTKCCICGNSDTGKYPNGDPKWIRYKDKKGIWDRKSYICMKCYHSSWYKDVGKIDPNSHNNIIKLMSKSRMGQLTIDDEQGIGLIGEAVVAKVRKLEIMSIKLDDFTYKFDLSNDNVYGDIQVKLRAFESRLHVHFNHDFDNLFILCLSKDMIERVYAIPEKELPNIGITINKYIYSIYDRFLIDQKPYSQ